MEQITQYIGKACRWLLLTMTITAGVNAILRYASKFAGIALSSNAFLELQWYLFGTIFLLGAGYSLSQQRHVRVDIFYANVSSKIRNWIDILGTVFFLLPFSLIGIYLSWDFVLNSWTILENSPDAGGLPRYPIKTMIPLGFLLLFLEGLRWLRGLWTEEVK